MSIIRREPALATAIITALVLVLGALLLRFTGTDIDEGAWTAIIVGALGIVGAGAVTRQQVTPNGSVDAKVAAGNPPQVPEV